MKNYTNFKNMTAVKNTVREDAFEAIREAMAKAYGEDNVSIVGSNELAIAVGEIDFKDGTSSEICVTLKPVVKEYENRKTSGGKEVEAFERLTLADDYEYEKEQKKKLLEEKARKREEKIKKQKEEKEKLKKEKEEMKKAKKSTEES